MLTVYRFGSREIKIVPKKQGKLVEHYCFEKLSIEGKASLGDLEQNRYIVSIFLT
jgi:hypothetical protein